MRFIHILYILYFIIGMISFGYLLKSYFPHNSTKFEKFVIFLMSVCWIFSVPVTAIFKKEQEGEEP